ncbi:unnamed protein product [Spirodela intermedia]|uniref:Pectinesterase n=1 Tax=Spirodela intermedia TaxID=51605 RepID=A0A7I8JW32_SPIIN|nr:unnamed protein product [Spirodela intermedia]CAA6673672.1 unnamed protein product [Spirodela intermedia]
MVKSFFVLPVIFLLLLLLLFLFSPASADGEEGYLNWVKRVGEGRKGSASGKLENRHKPCLELTVEKNSSKPGSFVSVQAAIDSLPPATAAESSSTSAPEEKVTIPGRKAYVTLLGEGRERTIIQWGDTADGEGPEGRRLGTFGSATFAVNSPFFVAMNVTFKVERKPRIQEEEQHNDNDNGCKDCFFSQNVAAPAPAGAEGKQAVALRISGDAAFFLGCGFHGGQDTLYDHRGRHFFKDCFIEGSVDFVFGDGRSLYEGCRLHAVAESYGAVAAQKRESFLEETGFSFLRCRVTGSGALYLGRAWGTFSRVVFAYSYLDKIVVPDGWYDWGDRNRQTTVFFGQYRCSGPGASLSGRVRWSRELTAQQAEPFLSTEFVDGSEWLEP